MIFQKIPLLHICPSGSQVQADHGWCIAFRAPTGEASATSHCLDCGSHDSRGRHSGSMGSLLLQE
ncbi:unnamed protein product [Timema podura]|uniref:Uncharacterized protein n=1 Tax=Timema podura TaxID=61482 RepID=A0ABN7P3P1_TIMPD|nr:unnamed protein product [Timema podura]